jgi:hypothetical protein
MGITRELLVELAGRDYCICGETLDETHRLHILEQVNQIPLETSDSQKSINFRPFPLDLQFDNYKSMVRNELNNSSNLSQTLLAKKTLLQIELNSEHEENSNLGKFKDLQRLKFELASRKSAESDLRAKISDLEEKKTSAEAKLARLINQGSLQERMQRNRVSVSKVRTHLQNEHENYSVRFLEELANELNVIVSNLISEPVRVQLRDNFDFDLVYQASGQLYGDAGGERKAKAMAMIIALHRIAARRAQSGNAIGNTVLRSFPIIIDSAFGDLGLDLRRRVAAEIIKDASQCILLLSDTQAPGVVDSLNQDEIASENLLHSFTTGAGQDIDSPNIGGKRVIWKTMNADVARTEVERIS